MTSGNTNPVRLCVCATLRKATRAVTQLYDDALRPAGMRATQFQTLMTIAETGNVTVTRLTRLLLIDQTTLTRNLAVLKRDGLLRDVQSSDGRLRSVKLTRKGERAIEAAIPLWSKVQKQVTNAIGMTGWASISAELEKLAAVGALSDEK